MNLQKKYFLIFSSIFIILSLAMSLTTYVLSNNILLSKYEDMNADSLSYLLEVTEKELDQLSSTFVFLSNDPTVHERIVTDYGNDNYRKLIDNNRVSDMLNAMSTFDIFKAIELLYIKGKNGEEYWGSTASDFLDSSVILKDIDIDSISPKGLEYHGIIENRNPYSDSDKLLRFTKSLVDVYADNVGTVYFELDTDYFKKIFDNQWLESDTELYLVDVNNIIIYHTNDYMVGRNLDTAQVKGVVVERPLGRYGWRLISESPEEQIYNESDAIFKTVAIMALASIIIGMIIISLTTSQIVKPIQRLSRAMKDVRKGDLEAQVYHISNDEVGELTNNFNRMTDELKENLNKEIEYNKAIKDAEYKALQAQINPHFMYNSLNALKWLAGIQGADNITEMVDALWTLLRKTSSMKGQFVTLNNEIEVIKAYCTIQQVRYKGKFDVIYELDEDHLSVMIPKYILQPFVENAIFHGIEPKKGPGLIWVRSEMDDDNLIIKVIDDGVGIPEEKVSRIITTENEQKHGAGLNNIGVKNINERLLLLFGPAYGIIVESVVGEGTTMTIKIPLKQDYKDGSHV